MDATLTAVPNAAGASAVVSARAGIAAGYQGGGSGSGRQGILSADTSDTTTPFEINFSQIVTFSDRIAMIDFIPFPTLITVVQY